MRTEGVPPVPRWFGLLMVALGLLLLAPGVPPAGRAGENEAPNPKPKLVVLLVIDQFRADYLERFETRFGPDGFKRLLREGAYFSSCYYPYGETLTAPGHATLATGATPDKHGIVGNDVYDERLGRVVPAVRDENYPAVGGGPNSRPVSPLRLEGSTLGDDFRANTWKIGKSFGVALKDRSAVFATGRGANAAYWFDETVGRFVTSEYYRKDLPGWVERFNREKGAARYFEKPWVVNGKVVRALTSASGEPDRRFYRTVRRTPHGNELAMDFVAELLKEEEMGTDGPADFLFVGFSANDLVGHDFGPYSPEVADMTGQTDRQVARLLGLLDEHVGKGNYWLVFSADHGVAPTIAQAREQGAPSVLVERKEIVKRVTAALEERWGKGEWLVPRSDKERMNFNRETIKRFEADLDEVARVAGEAASSAPGVLGYFSPFHSNLSPELVAAYKLSYYPGRSPDVIMVPKPFHFVRTGDSGGHHGTAHAYDRYVPLLFFGPAFRAGRYDEPVTPADMAPTVAAAMEQPPPMPATGRVLTEALRTGSGNKESRKNE